MRSSLLSLAIVLSVASSVHAQQPAVAVDREVCAAQLAAIEQDLVEARAKGRMLLGRKLAEQLAALQRRCNAPPAQISRQASIEVLEQEVEALRSELQRTEEQLRKLKNAAP